MDKEDVVCMCVCVYTHMYAHTHAYIYIHVMECYSAITKNKILPFRNMDGSGDYHNKWG